MKDQPKKLESFTGATVDPTITPAVPAGKPAAAGNPSRPSATASVSTSADAPSAPADPKLPSPASPPAFDLATFDFGPPEDLEEEDVDPEATTANEPEAKPEPKKPEAPNTPAAPKFSAELTERAEQAGFDAEDLAEFTSEKQLKIALDKLDKKTPREAPREAPKPPPPASAPKVERKPYDRKKWEDKGYDKDLVDEMEQAHNEREDTRLALAQVRAENESFRQAEQQRAFQTYVKQVDGAIDALPEEYHQFLGAKASPTEKWFKSDEFKNRTRVERRAQAILGAYPDGDPDRPTLDQALREAARGLFGEQIGAGAEERARKSLSDAARTQAGRGSARPTSRQTPPLSPEQAARRDIRTVLNGLSSQSDDELRDGFIP